MLTYERLRELFHYDPATGLFTRLVRQGHTHPGEIAGGLSEKGYVRIYIDGRKYRAHRLAWLYVTGEWPENEIDHKNTDRSDNRWDNLRPATGAENSRNRRTPSNNTSGFKGVFWQKREKRWHAVIDLNGKRVVLGRFLTVEEAHAAYARAAQEHYGEFSRADGGHHHERGRLD